MVFIGLEITTNVLRHTLPVVKSDKGDELRAAVANGNDVLAPSRNRTTHIAFLKVHKAGSTTMQNLLFRFGVRHDLKILLPKSGNYLYRAAEQVPLKPHEHYDIFACHTIYSKTLFNNLLPGDSVTLGIVREPVRRMISSAYYYRDVYGFKYLKKIPKVNYIHNLVNFPEIYDKGLFSYTRNAMGWDFGFPNNIKATDKDRIRHYLDELNSQFSLVMVMERFDESLVLMKRILNWSLLDILYIKTNTHEHRSVLLNNTEQTSFRKSSFLDFEIYEYFSHILDLKLQEEDDSFKAELVFYKTVLDQMTAFCVTHVTHIDRNLVIEGSRWNREFNVSRIDCELMKVKELPFIIRLRNHVVHKK